MPIQFQHGQVSSIAKLANMAGEQLAARREYERRQEQIQRAQEMQKQEYLAGQQRSAQIQLAQYEQQNQVRQQAMAMDWETQKLALNSQHDFAMEKMREEAFAKREITQQIRKMDEYEQGAKKIREMHVRGEIDDDHYQYLLNNMTSKVFGDVTYPYPRQEKTVDPLLDMRKQLEAIVGKVGENMPLNILQQQAETVQKRMTPTTTTKRVRVVSPDGQTGTIEEAELQTYLAQGFRRV